MKRQAGMVLIGYLAMIAVVLLGLAAWQINRLEAKLDDANKAYGGERVSREQHQAAAALCSKGVAELETAGREQLERWQHRDRVAAANRATAELEIQRLLADRPKPGEDPCVRAERIYDAEIDRRHPPQ